MNNKVYAQVYSLIRAEHEGLIPALHEFSKAGYDGIEIVGANTGDLPVDEFKALLEELKLKVIAVHGLGSAGETELAKALGVDHIAFDAQFHGRSRQAVVETCRELNEIGMELRTQGLRLSVHNHADEFAWVEGEEGRTRIYDLLLSETDPELVSFQLDTGWAARAGADCVEYVKNNPGRFPMIHVKECCEVAKNEDELAHFPKHIVSQIQRDEHGTPIFTDEIKAKMYETRSWNRGLGQGIIDWKALYEAAEAQGCEAYISEREYYHFDGSDGTALCCIKLDCDFLRSL